ncbi:hypothetical protein [Desulfobacca acetoxidans]
MAYKVIIRRHDGVQSYLVLDDQPRELLRHAGFLEEFSTRIWYGSLAPDEALEEWAEMIGEDPFGDNYQIVDSSNWEFIIDKPEWDKRRPNKS